LLVAYGYRYGEVELPKLKEVKGDYKFHPIRRIDLDSRRPAMTNMCNFYYKDCLNPHGDATCPLTMVAGVRKRFAFRPPKAKRGFYLRFRRFVERWCVKNLVPLSYDTDISFETWLMSTSYSEARKEELRQKFLKVGSVYENKKYFDCKSFMKDEPYSEYKQVRAINSRSDEFKCYVGPTFKAIEKVLFKLEYFVKNVPVADRPAYIYDKLYKVGATYKATDYTAFESLFVSSVMKSCEFVLYDYMTQNLPNHTDFMWLMNNVLAGQFKCKFKNFSVDVSATRMSGEMCTSLGNGFTNLMLMLFLCEENGCTEVNGVVEGDDGLFSIVGKAPSAEQFAECGFVIKMEEHTNLAEASFCGCVFDVDDKVNVTNPIDKLLEFGWCKEAYALSSDSKKMQLLRAKALSMAHQYKGCPVLQSFAQHVLYCTRSFTIDHKLIHNKGLFGFWEQNKFDYLNIARVDPIPVPYRTRLLVEKLYKIPVDLQHSIERYFDTTKVLQPYAFPGLDHLIHPHAKHYFYTYVRRVDRAQITNQSDFLPFKDPKEFEYSYSN
jgi:hypothetical protein